MKIKESIISCNEENYDRNRLIATPGLWIDGKTYWVKNSREKHILEEGISIKLKQDKPHSKIKQFDIYVTNHNSYEKQLKILMMHEYDNRTSDHFTFLSPAEKAIYHMADDVIYRVEGKYNGQEMNQYTIQHNWNFYNNQFWKNEEEGIFNYQPMAKGAAVSLFSFHICMRGRETACSHSWIFSGRSKSEILNLNASFLKTH